MADKREMVLVGGGHAHVQVLKEFADAPPVNCNITVVVDDPVAMYSGMAPGFVAGQYSREELEIDVRPLARLAKAEVIVARCESVDPERQLLHLAVRKPLRYDIASFNIGSTVLGLELPGVRQHALATRPLSGLVGGIAQLIERAHAHQGDQPFHIVVVGGGVGGVELAFAVEARLENEIGRAVQVTLLDSGERILPRYPDALVHRIQRMADKRGITLRMGERVTAVHQNHVALKSGEQLNSNAILWVTGPTSHPVFTRSPGIETDDRGFALMRSTLQLDGYDNLFAVGDCGTLIDYPKTPKAGVYAVREGPFITHNLKALVAGEPLREYLPQGDFLTLLNLGHGYAVGAKWGVTFGGKWVMRWKDSIDRKFMTRFQVL